MKRIIISILCLILLWGAGFGCTPKIPKDALQLNEQSLANRQMQTRRFETGNYDALVLASNDVLQDLGFTLEESEIDLGVLVGSKNRDATDGGQIAASIFVAALTGVAAPVDSHQTIRVSLVVRPLEHDAEEEIKTQLSEERIKDVGKRVHTALMKGLAKEFPEDVCDNIADQIAANVTDALTDDLTTFMSVKDMPGQAAVRCTFQRVVYNTHGLVSRLEQVNNPELYQQFFDKLAQSVFLEAHEI